MQKLSLFLFWGAAVGVFYTYFGYPFWIYFRSQYRPHPWVKHPTVLSVSVILPVHNCGAVLKEKIDQLIALDYPKDQIEFIIVSDGSNDETERILKECSLVTPVVYPERRGKAAALNAGIARANGEILLFSDIRPKLTSPSLHSLLDNFADSRVGCASGRLVLGEADLGVTKTHSRPHVSDDNPYSESQFRTMKYRPEFPDRFGCIQDSRAFSQEFFRWYNEEHRHSGLALLTPAMVHYNQTGRILQQRQHVLDAAYQLHPERCVRQAPKPSAVLTEVWINKPPNSNEKTH
jgi:Glycosyl transferase family 2/Integrase core domain